MASVVLSLTVLGVSGTLITAASQTATAQDDHVAMSLATALMESISALPMTSAAVPGTGGWSSTNRIASTYDNIADYDGYTDYFAVEAGRVSADGRPLVATTAVDAAYLAANGITFPATTGAAAKVFRRVVSFQYRATPSGPAATSGPFGRVTVSVTANRGGAAVQIVRLFTDVDMMQ